MERIFGENSEYSEETRSELKQVMLVREQERTDFSVYGKTGMGKTDGMVVDAWFTGFAETAEGNLYFCVRLGRTDGRDVSSAFKLYQTIRLCRSTNESTGYVNRMSCAVRRRRLGTASCQSPICYV